MKFLNKIKSAKILSREELKEIKAGGNPELTPGGDYASATAYCGGHSVTCSGTYSCTATDHEGCSCDDGADEKTCIVT